jgi:hypothetical protein
MIFFSNIKFNFRNCKVPVITSIGLCEYEIKYVDIGKFTNFT